MNHKDLKKEGEFRIAKQFIDWFNEKNKTSYRIEKEEDDDTNCDIRMITDRDKQYDIQVVTSEGEIIKQAVMNSKSFKKDGSMKAMDVRLKDWIVESVNKKENRYPKEVKKNTILLISGGFFISGPNYLDSIKDVFKETYFNSIYYVSRPMSSYPETDYSKNGFVFGFKE